MARYLVGYGSNCWNFKDAYEAASPGDIIEFDRDFNYIVDSGQSFTISKDLTFIGVFFESEDKGLIMNTVLTGFFQVTNGVNVTFKNILFYQDQNLAFIDISKESTVNFENVLFERVIDSEKVGIFCDNSNIVATDIFVRGCKHTIKAVYKSTVTITDSTILNSPLIIEDSILKLDNVSIEFGEGNIINGVNSEIDINDSRINSTTPLEKNWPAIWLKNSKLSTSSSIVEQDDYEYTINLLDRSSYTSNNDTIEAVSLWDSFGYFNDTTIKVGLFQREKSYVFSSGNLNFLGQNNEKIDIYINNKSTLISDTIELNRYIDPNIKVNNNSFFNATSLIAPNDNVDDIVIEVDDSSINKTVKNNKFNAKPISQKENKEDALDQLNNLIGLKQVKQEIHKMLRLVEFNKKRQEQGLKQEKQALHCVFMGNPGTGKTTVARLMGQILFEYGVLTGETPIFEEVSQEDLVSQNVGGTAPQTRKWLDKARGGILFVDEAYNLYKKEGINHGQEAIDTIMKYMEDYRDEIIVIFAGYTKEMEQFLKSNPGLESRAPNILYFEDYSEAEIVKMGQMILEKDQYTLEDPSYYSKHVSLAYGNSLDGSNARWIRNFNQKLTRTLANRVIEEDAEDVSLIINKDIDSVVNINRAEFVNSEDALEKLNKLIGIQKVKEQINDFIALADMNKKRADAGLKTDDFSLHSLFLGNPGTGKTTVARIVGDLLFQKGIIKQNKFIEASRSDLVGKYIGHTAAKTREVLESALGGILFIDEAYTLNAKSENDFGQEAIDEILKFMEDHRRDIVIIFAGYNKEMADFLNTNSGLRSRVPNVFDFTDYTPDEIVSIGLLKLHSSGYNINETYYAENVKEAYIKSNDNSNGRWIRNYNERLLRIVSRRLANANVSPEEYNNIIDEDILKMKEV